MTRPKQSVRGNLILLGVFLLPAAVALLAYKATGSAAAGWLTLALTTGLLLSAVAAFIASIHISHARPSMPRYQRIWLVILVFALASIIGMGSLALARW